MDEKVHRQSFGSLLESALKTQTVINHMYSKFDCYECSISCHDLPIGFCQAQNILIVFVNQILLMFSIFWPFVRSEGVADRCRCNSTALLAHEHSCSFSCDPSNFVDFALPFCSVEMAQLLATCFHFIPYYKVLDYYIR